MPARARTPRPPAADLTGLAPFTKYHYRLVAQNEKGTTSAVTAPSPRRSSRWASALPAPQPATWGQGRRSPGQLTGTGNANRTVKLQQKAFPYTSNFADVGNPLVTDGNGNFGFVVPLLTVTHAVPRRHSRQPEGDQPSRDRRLGGARRLQVEPHTRAPRPRVRFSGHVTPANDGALFAIQRLSKGNWVTVKGGSLRHGTTTSSRYRKTLHIRHFGKYRVFVGVNNQNTSGVSREVRLRRAG